MSAKITETQNAVTLSFIFNRYELEKTRYLKLREGPAPYSFPQINIYSPIQTFLNNYQTTGYPFKMYKLLHVAGVEMLVGGPSLPRARTLFATGGLYLALDHSHPNLCFKRSFGDFTSGFSHQFGVALALMSMSEAFSIPWAKLNRIPVKGKRVFDYESSFSGNKWLKLEAKGISTNGWSGTRKNAYSKKLTNQKNQNPVRRSFSKPTAMVGVIVQAARSRNENAILELIDPDFEENPAVYDEANQLAGEYLHYSGVARFAGLHSVSKEFIRRAQSLIDNKPISQSQWKWKRKVQFEKQRHFDLYGKDYLGVQWRLGDIHDTEDDIWFYQLVAKDVIKTIIESNEFPHTKPYHFFETEQRFTFGLGESIESFLPDGSYFGIGTGPREGMLTIDAHSTNLNQIKIAKLSNAPISKGRHR